MKNKWTKPLNWIKIKKKPLTNKNRLCDYAIKKYWNMTQLSGWPFKKVTSKIYEANISEITMLTQRLVKVKFGMW